MRKMSKVFRVSFFLMLVSIMLVGGAMSAHAAEAESYSVTFNYKSVVTDSTTNARSLVDATKTFVVAAGTDLTADKDVKDLQTSKYYDIQGDAELGTTAKVAKKKFSKWINESKKAAKDELKSVSRDMVVTAKYNDEISATDARCFISYNGEVAEDGTTAYSQNVYTEVVLAKVYEFKQINSKNTENYEEEILKLFAENAPQVEDFTYDSKYFTEAPTNDTYEIKWYVMKYIESSNVKWHIDGALVKKEVVETPVDETEETVVTEETVIAEETVVAEETVAAEETVVTEETVVAEETVAAEETVVAEKTAAAVEMGAAHQVLGLQLEGELSNASSDTQSVKKEIPVFGMISALVIMFIAFATRTLYAKRKDN